MFDFQGFLDGKLVHLPPKFEPALMTADEKRQFHNIILDRGEEFFSADFPYGIIWAREGGGCMVPLPSIIYNGSTRVAESQRRKPVANHLYQFCGVDDSSHYRTYHGVYRCMRVVTASWEHLASLDRKLADRFLARVVVGSGAAPPMFVSLIHDLYVTGAMKVHFVVLRCEYFDSPALKQVRSTGEYPTITTPSYSGFKRPTDRYQGRSEGSSKKPRLMD